MRKIRRLHVTPSGFWYLGLTILLGLVALASGNNAVYLIESLLLSGLILSGILSEQTIARAKIRIERRGTVAGERCQDRIHIENTSWRTLYCVEVGEWRDGVFVPLAFFSRVAPRTTASARSLQTFEKRGAYEWAAVALATSYPYGFARKIRVIGDRGRRVIWPKLARGRAAEIAGMRRAARRSGGSFLEGEVRPLIDGDDHRHVVWTLSARGTRAEDLLIRARAPESRDLEVAIDLRASGEELERRLSSAAGSLHALLPEEHQGLLVVRDGRGVRRVNGARRGLDLLATAGLEPQRPGRAALVR